MSANLPERPPVEPARPREPSALEERREDREKRIAELEKKLARPTNVGVTPLVALVVLGFTATLLWGQRSDFEYQFLAPRAPIDLGSEGAYRFEFAVSNRYVQIHGRPSARGWYWLERNTRVVGVGIVDTPILLRRPTLPTENWKVGEPPPRPDERPFTVKGRLLSREDAPEKYAQALAEYEKWAQSPVKWILLQEDTPGGDLGGQAWLALLGAFALLNVWLLVRGSIRLLARG